MADQELGAQASIQTQINATLEARIKKLEEINDSLSRQLKITRDIQSSMDGNQSGIDGTNKLAAASDKAATSQSNLASKALEVQKTQAKIKENIGGITNAFGSWFSSVTNIASALGGVVGTLLNFGKALISVPFDIFDAFIEKANALPYNTALFQALQEIKKAFGDLATGPGKAVADNLKTIRHNMRDLVGTGLTLHSVFGYGPEGAAEALKAVNDLAVQLGASFFNLTGFIRKSGLEMVVMAKGLGLSNEQMAQQIKFAQAMGKDPKKAQDEFASAAIQTAKAFGMAHKVIARGMSDLLQQFPNLAKQGPKALAPIVAYAQKLGIEIKDLTGVMDKFSSFEGAADATSQLSQAFGVNVDAMRIMAAESPAEKLEMLRKGFQSAGVDSEHMSYSQRKLAKDLTGATDALFDQAFGLGNQKVKLSETEKQAQQAMKTQMEHTKIMKELGKAIEKIAPPEPKKFKGFFEAFAEGFSDGIFWTHSMRKAMWALRASMQQIYWAGREVGRIFVEYFPGVKKMLEGVYNIFKPSNFRHLRTEIIPIFREFFQDMDFGKLFDKLSDAVNRTLGGGAGTGLGQLKQGFMAFAAAAGKVIGSAIEKIGELITEGIIGITEIIRNPKAFLDKVGAGASQAMTVGQSFLNPIAEGFAKAGPQVWTAITDLFVEIWKQVKTWWTKEGKQKVTDFLSEYKWEILGILAAMNPGAVLSAAVSFGSLLFNVTNLGIQIASKNPGIMSAIGSFGSKMSNALGGAFFDAGTKMMASNSPLMQRMGTMMANAGLSVSGGLGASITSGLAGLGAGSALAGGAVVLAGVSAVAGLYQAYKFGDTPEDKELEKTGFTYGDQAASTFFKGITLGMYDARGQIEEAQKQVKELVKKTSTAQAEGFKEAAQEAKSVSQNLLEKAVAEGRREDASAYMVQVELQNAIAKGELDASKMTGEEYIAALKKFKDEAREKLKPQLDKVMREAADKALKEAADKNEAEKMAKIEKAKTLVERIKDIGELKTELDKGMTSLDRALAGKDFETKISKISDKIAQIYPKIEQAMLKIQNARTQSVGKFSDEDDPVASLATVIKGMSAVADATSAAAQKVSPKMLQNLDDLLVVLFGPANQTSTKSIIAKIKSASVRLEGMELNSGSFKTFSDSFEDISKGVNTIVGMKSISEAKGAQISATIFQLLGFGTNLQNMQTTVGMIDTGYTANVAAAANDISTAANALSKSAPVTSKNIDAIVNFVDRLATVSGTASVYNVATMATGLGKLAENAITAGGVFKNVAEATTTFRKLKEGQVSISHNIPGVKMEINVHLDAVHLAKTLATTDITVSQTNSKFVALSTKKGNISEDSDSVV